MTNQPISRATRRRRPGNLHARRNRRGAVAVLLAVLITPLMGMVVIAVDIGILFRVRRNAQLAADAAAVAYAHERFFGASPAIAGAALMAQADTNGFRNGTNHVSIDTATVTWGATTNAMKVGIRDTFPTFFGAIVKHSKAAIYASAIATYDLAKGDACVYALDPSGANAFNVDNNGDVTTAGCGIVVNSSNAAALNVSNNADITATTVAVTGGATIGNNGAIHGTLSTNVAPTPSPAAQVTPPTPAGSCITSSTGNNGNATLSAGTYCSISASNNATINLNPGLYILKGGDLTLSNNAHLSGTGVTIAFMSNGTTYGSPSFANNAVVSLSAPTTGAWAGMLFYKPAAAPNAGVTLLGNNSNMTLNGSLYFPSQTLSISNNGTLTVTGAVVAYRVSIANNAGFNIPTPTTGTVAYFAVKRVTLVE